MLQQRSASDKLCSEIRVIAGAKFEMQEHGSYEDLLNPDASTLFA